MAVDWTVVVLKRLLHSNKSDYRLNVSYILAVSMELFHPLTYTKGLCGKIVGGFTPV